MSQLTGISAHVKSVGRRWEFCSLIAAHNVLNCPKRVGFKKDQEWLRYKGCDMNDTDDIEMSIICIDKRMHGYQFFTKVPLCIFGRLNPQKYKYSCIIKGVQSPVGDGEHKWYWSVRELIFE